MTIEEPTGVRKRLADAIAKAKHNAEPMLVVLKGVTASLTGLSITLRHLLRKPITIQYPEQFRQPFTRFKGRHVLDRHPDGLEKCIGCELCAGACPADAILVIGADNTPEDRRSPGERYAAVYEINYLRCIFCGLCVEACPTEALIMSNAYDLSSDSRESMIFTKEQLLVGAPLQIRTHKEDLAQGEEVGEFRTAKKNLAVKRDGALPSWASLSEVEDNEPYSIATDPKFASPAANDQQDSQ